MSATQVKRTAPNRLASLLDGYRVATSSELIKALTKSGLTEANSRQIVSRHSNVNGIWRSEKLRLARDERLFALKNSVGTVPFFESVGEKLNETSRRGLARCVAALARHKVLNRVDLIRLLAVPNPESATATRRSGPTYSDELEALRELGARVLHPNTALESIVAPAVSDGSELDALANQGAECLRYAAMLTRILAERLRRQNMISWNRIDLPGPNVPFTVFNDHVFSGFGFSYLSSVVRWKADSKNPTPCPVLIDCYHGDCSMAQVKSFVQRIDRTTMRGRGRLPSLGVIAARDFDRDAWGEARKHGLMTVSFRQLFGDEALDAMIQVEKLISGLTSASTADAHEQFQEITQLFDELKTNPVIADLRSIGLEALCGLILQAQGYAHPELGRVVPWKETTRDVDVFAVRGDSELRIVECKAYHRRKSIIDMDVRKFFTETVPALKAWMRTTDRHFKTCTAEIWTTGPIGQEAEKALRELKKPSNDTWKLRRMSDMHSEIPHAIKERSVKLLAAISLTESDQSVGVDQD